MLNILGQPLIRQYINDILNGGISSDEKVQKISEIMKTSEEFEAKLMAHQEEILRGSPDERTQLVSTIAQQLGLWNPAGIIASLDEAIRRGVARLLRSQHPDDGGWGSRWRESDYWNTAWALLSLREAGNLVDVDAWRVTHAIEKGLGYFRKNDKGWAFRHYAKAKGDHEFSNYDMPLVLRTLHAFHDSFCNDLEEEIRRTLELVVTRQNRDGGWDQTIRARRSCKSPSELTQVFSDVSPTSQVLQTLTYVDAKTFRNAADRALRWIVKYQNGDGSWDLGSTRPETIRTQNDDGSWPPGNAHSNSVDIYCDQEGQLIKGFPTIPKTCDGLQGIFSWAEAESENVAHQGVVPTNKEIESRIQMAVTWLQMQEKPIFEPAFEVTQWSGHDYTNTCITLEALVRHPDTSLPLRTSNARWLIDNQVRKPNDDDDGKWPFEQTPRIIHCLIQFYKKARTSPAFLA